MTDRDMKVVEFIQKYKLCTTNQIYKIYFNKVDQTVCQRRLRYLVEYGYIDRFKFAGNNYVYYFGKKISPKLIHHDLLITDVVIKFLEEGYEILDFKKSFVLGDVISDAYIKVSKDNKIKNVLLEVQLGTHDCISKYKNIKRLVLENTDWDVFPRLIVVGDVNKRDIRCLKITYLTLKMEGELL